jgi:integrase
MRRLSTRQVAPYATMLSVKIYPKPSRNGWIVRYPITQSDGTLGHAEIFRKNRTEALQEKKRKEEELNLHGLVGSLPPKILSDLQQALSILGEGTTLTEVAQFWAQHRQGNTIPDVTLSEAVEQYIAETQNVLAKTTWENRTRRLRSFCEAMEEEPQLAEISTEHIECYVSLNSDNEHTRNSVLSAIRVFFAWCTERKVNLLTESPAKELKKEDIEFSSPEFLDVREVEQILREAEARDPALLPYLVLGFFGGVRPEELLRISTRDIHIEDRTINIRGEVAKRKRKGKPLPRLVEGLPDAIWAWLEPHCDEDGRLRLDVRNASKRRNRICERLGISWPNSGARHCFITYGVAMTQNVGQVAAWSGHRTLSVLFDRYRGLTGKKSGEAYFALRPSQECYLTQARSSANVADWPPKERLSELVWRMPTTQVARQLGVSDKAVEKRCRRLGIAKPPRGYWAKYQSNSKKAS